MDVQAETKSDGTATLTITVSVAECAPHLEAAARQLSSEHPIAGFRPGKAPVAVVARERGEHALWEAAAEQVVQQSYPAAVARQQLETIGPPEITLTTLAPGNPLVYQAAVVLLPAVTVGDYRTFKAKEEPVTVDPAAVEQQLLYLRRMRASEAAVTRPARTGDKVEVDFDVYVDGVAVPGAKSANHPLIIGDGQFIPGFEEQIVGVAPHVSKTFTLTFPNEYRQSDLAGKSAEFRVTVKKVTQVDLPTADDSFATTLGAASIGELKNQLESVVRKDHEREHRERYESALLTEVVARSTVGPFAAPLVSGETNAMIAELKQNVEAQGMQFADYLTSIKKAEADLERELEPRARERIRASLVLRAIAEAEHIVVADEELERELADRRVAYKNDPAVLARFSDDDFRDRLRTVLRNRKVFDFLVAVAAKRGTAA